MFRRLFCLEGRQITTYLGEKSVLISVLHNLDDARSETMGTAASFPSGCSSAHAPSVLFALSYLGIYFPALISGSSSVTSSAFWSLK